MMYGNTNGDVGSSLSAGPANIVRPAGFYCPKFHSSKHHRSPSRNITPMSPPGEM